MKNETEWKTVEASVWKPANEGDQLIGVLVSKEPRDEQTGYSAKYYIENSKGMFLVWGTAVIDDRMKHVTIGQKLRISYEGKAQNKRGQDVKLFKIEVANQPDRQVDMREETAGVEDVE